MSNFSASRSPALVARITIRQLAGGLRLDGSDEPQPNDPVTLERDDFDQALACLHAVEWPFQRSADEAWLHFRGWRVNYETAAYAIASYLDLPPAPWSGPRHPTKFIAPARPPDHPPK